MFVNSGLLDSKNILLIKKLYEGNLSKDDVDFLIKGLNLDTGDFQYMTLLAQLGSKEGWQYFPEKMVPRLKGFLRYFQVQNLFEKTKIVPFFKLLNDNGIDILLIKDAAVKEYYSSKNLKMMYNFEMAVDKKNFNKTIKLIKYTDFKKVHIDSSKAIYNYTDDKRLNIIIHCMNDSDIFNNAINHQMMSVPVKIVNRYDFILSNLNLSALFLPNFENLWFTRNFILNFLDVYEKSINFDELMKKAAASGKEKFLILMCEEISKCSDNLVPVIIQDNNFINWKKIIMDNLMKNKNFQKNNIFFSIYRCVNNYKLYKITVGNVCSGFNYYLKEMYGTSNLIGLAFNKIFKG